MRSAAPAPSAFSQSGDTANFHAPELGCLRYALKLEPIHLGSQATSVRS